MKKLKKIWILTVILTMIFSSHTYMPLQAETEQYEEYTIRYHSNKEGVEDVITSGDYLPYSDNVNLSTITLESEEIFDFGEEKDFLLSWNTKSDGTGKTYLPNSKFNPEFPNSSYALRNVDEPVVDFDLYAIWTGTSMVTFHSNNPTDIAVKQRYPKRGEGARIPYFSELGFHIEGEFADYWKTANGEAFLSGESGVFAEDIDLYAAQSAKTERIIYHQNHNDQDEVVWINEHPYEEIADISQMNFSVPEGGTEFSNWYTIDKEGNILFVSSYYFDPDAYDCDGILHIYANWVMKLTTLKFDGNGHTSGVPISDISYDSDQDSSIQIPTQGQLKKDGNYFVGWNSKKDGTGDFFAPGKISSARLSTLFAGDAFIGSKGITLYAIWAKDNVTIQYDANQASGTIPSDTTNYPLHSAITIKDHGDLIQGDKEFRYWCTDPSGYGDVYYPGDIVSAVKNLKLYAIFYTPTKSDTFKVVYDCGTEFSITCPVDDKAYKIGDIITIKSLALKEFKQEDAIFDGWYATGNHLDKYYYYQADNVVMNKSILNKQGEFKLRIDWKSDASQTKVLRYEDGMGALIRDTYCEEYSSENPAYIYTVHMDDASQTPKRKGYIFTGWNTEINGKGTSYKYWVNDEEVQNIEIQDDFSTLYAQWIPLEEAKNNPNFVKLTVDYYHFFYDKEVWKKVDTYETYFPKGDYELNSDYFPTNESWPWDSNYEDEVVTLTEDVTVRATQYGVNTQFSTPVVFLCKVNGALRKNGEEVLYSQLSSDSLEDEWYIGKTLQSIPTPIPHEGYAFVGWKVDFKYLEIPSYSLHGEGKDPALEQSLYFSKTEDLADFKIPFSSSLYNQWRKYDCVEITAMFAPANTFRVSIEYYYDHKLDPMQTELMTGLYNGTEITSYTDKWKEGYKLEKVENLPFVVHDEDGIIRIYYVTDTKEKPELPIPVEPEIPLSPTIDIPKESKVISETVAEHHGSVNTGDQSHRTMFLIFLFAAGFACLVAAIKRLQNNRNK